MKREIIVVVGSPRREGNSSILAEQAALGARDAGANVEIFHLNELKIAPCQACGACQMDIEENCAIDDDMQHLYPKLREADAILIAGPVYWFTVSAQTKLFMDRCYALGSREGYAIRGKKIGIILTYGGADAFDSGAVNAMRTFQDGFGFIGAEIVGMVHGSASTAGEVRENEDLMQKAFELGRTLASS
jgi:multimeric flavodoxin WrbA